MTVWSIVFWGFWLIWGWLIFAASLTLADSFLDRREGTELSNLTEFARGQECTFQIPGVCNRDPETTVLCHLPDFGLAGMGQKVHDLIGAHGCSACHDFVDNRVRKASMSVGALRSYKYRALVRTLDRVGHEFQLRR